MSCSCRCVGTVIMIEVCVFGHSFISFHNHILCNLLLLTRGLGFFFDPVTWLTYTSKLMSLPFSFPCGFRISFTHFVVTRSHGEGTPSISHLKCPVFIMSTPYFLWFPGKFGKWMIFPGNSRKIMIFRGNWRYFYRGLYGNVLKTTTINNCFGIFLQWKYLFSRGGTGRGLVRVYRNARTSFRADSFLFLGSWD